jgi:dynein heavy chain
MQWQRCCAILLTVPCCNLQVPIFVQFPEGRLVYDFVLDRSKLKWVPWLDRLESKALDTDAEYSSIIVPTMDTLRYTYLLDALVQHKHHCLFVGPTGTGKTVRRGA